MGVRGDLAGYYDEARRDERLAGDPTSLVGCEDGVQDGVGDLIRDLIGVALCDLFGCKKVAAGVAQAFRLLGVCCKRFTLAKDRVL